MHPAPPPALEPGFRQVRQELQQLDYFLKDGVLKRLMKMWPTAVQNTTAIRPNATAPPPEGGVQGQRPDRQREAQPGGCSSTLSGRRQAAP